MKFNDTLVTEADVNRSAGDALQDVRRSLSMEERGSTLALKRIRDQVQTKSIRGFTLSN